MQNPIGDFFLYFLTGCFVLSAVGAVAMLFDKVRRIFVIDTKTANSQVNIEKEETDRK